MPPLGNVAVMNVWLNSAIVAAPCRSSDQPTRTWSNVGAPQRMRLPLTAASAAMAMTTVVLRQRRPAASQLNRRACARTEICPWWGMGRRSCPVLGGWATFVDIVRNRGWGGLVVGPRAPVVRVGHAQTVLRADGHALPEPGRVTSPQERDQQPIRGQLAAAGSFEGNHLEEVDGVLLRLVIANRELDVVLKPRAERRPRHARRLQGRPDHPALAEDL